MHIVPDVVRVRVGPCERNECSAMATADICNRGALRKLCPHLGHRWEPNWYEQIVEPSGRQSLGSTPEVVVVRCQRDATTLPECLLDAVEHGCKAYQLIEASAQEHRTTLLGEERRVLDRQRKAPARGIVFKIPGAGHPAQPLTDIAFNNPGPGRQFLAR